MGSFLVFVGRNSFDFVRYVGGMAGLGKDAAYWTLGAPLGGKGLRGRSAVHQMVLTGVNAIPIVSLIALFVGLILAFQSAYELRKYGGTIYVVNLVADFVGIAGGSLFPTVELGMPMSYYWTRAVDALLLKDILSGLVKSVV